MRYKHVLNRRTLLRGATGVAIGLPFLDEMQPNSVWGAAPEPPARCLTLFYALGIPPEQVAERFNGPLAPLAPFADKLAFFPNVDASKEGAYNGETAHPAGGTTVFTGIGGKREAGFGPSIDQVIKKAVYPNGTPTPIGTLSTATFFRRNGYFKRYRCYNEDGTRTVDAYEDPTKTFEAVFGSLGPKMQDPTDPAAARKWRLERSVLDTVIQQYQHYTSEASNLGQASISRIKDHLERIRELELRVFPKDGEGNNPAVNCESQQPPIAPNLPYGTEGGENEAAPVVAAADFQAAYRLNAEMTVTAIRCDLVRFGSFQFESPGGHTCWSGTYSANGQTYTFDPDKSEHQSWHDGRMDDVWWNAHFMQSQMAFTLGLLDDPAYLDPNGRTLLDNAMILMGTEVGWNHDHKGVLHACSSANERINVGTWYEQGMTGVDLYTTLARAYGVGDVVGVDQYFGGEVAGVLA